MNKNQSLLRKLKAKSVLIHLGDRTFRMRLLTLALFGLAVVILIIAIIVLIIVNACSSVDAQEDPFSSVAVSPTPEEVLLEPEPTDIPEEEPNGEDEIEPEDPEGDEGPEQENVPVESTPNPSSDEFTGTLKTGDSAEIVKVIQQRLVDLYYMDYPLQEKGSYSVTSKYGSTTSSAVKLFQERNDLPANGECDEATYKKIISPNANPYIMKQNDKCNMVKVIQTKLKEKGYLDKVTGFCGNDTITAVTNFQKASGLTPDGIAGPGTLKLLLGH